MGFFVEQTCRLGDPREEFVTDKLYRVGTTRAAVCRSPIHILTENCIPEIPVSSLFVQIIKPGNKQIYDHIRTFGIDFKTQSIKEMN